MRRLLATVSIGLLVVGIAAPVIAQESAAAAEPAGVVDAFKQGTFHLGLRYRFELVDQDGIAAQAYASTLRTVLNYRSAPLHGFDFFIEAENVFVLGDDTWYRDAGRPPRGNGVAGRPVVADPAGTDINQVMLRYRGGDTDVRFGRQEINLADQRFAGAVAWRQHHQTFTAFNVSNSSIGRVALQYAFISHVYRIFGDKIDTANNLLHATIDAGKLGTVRAYGILLHYRDDSFAGLSTNSFGFELAGSQPLNDAVTVHYEGEYAHQTDAADNPADVSANYAHVMGGFGFERFVTVRVGWELLGGSRDDGAFSTPLATLHKFNGWADKFLATPPDGLQDFYVQLDGRVAPIAWMLVFHQFNADSASATYGSEVDWQISYATPWSQSIALKGAYYSADTFATDTLKVWLTTAYTF